jgi:hypothetical protein
MKTYHDFERKPSTRAVAAVAQSTDPKSRPPRKGQNKTAQSNALEIADKKSSKLFD